MRFGGDPSADTIEQRSPDAAERLIDGIHRPAEFRSDRLSVFSCRISVLDQFSIGRSQILNAFEHNPASVFEFILHLTRFSSDGADEFAAELMPVFAAALAMFQNFVMRNLADPREKMTPRNELLILLPDDDVRLLQYLLGINRTPHLRENVQIKTALAFGEFLHEF